MARSNSDNIARFIRGEIDDKYILHTNVRSGDGGTRFQMPDGGPIKPSASQLISYATPIASAVDEDTILVNPNKYSISTTAHQSSLTSQLMEYGYENTERTAKPLNTLGWMRHDDGWAWHIWKRVEIPALTEREAAAVNSAYLDARQRIDRGQQSWSRTDDLRKLRALREMQEGVRRLDYVYTEEFLDHVEKIKAEQEEIAS